MENDFTNTLRFKLARVMIAVGWADGNLDHDEINAMKSMMFRYKDINSTDWAKLEIIMEKKPSDDDLRFYLEDLIASIKSKSDKEFILNHLKELISVDGKISSEEQVLFNEIEHAINETSTGVINLFGGFARKLISKGSQMVQNSLNIEEDVELYLRNKILYDIKEKFPDIQNSFSEKELKKWSAGAGLLGRVAMVDNLFDEAEKKSLVKVLQDFWNIDPRTAYVTGELVKKRIEDGVKDIHKSVQYDYLARSFYEETTYKERVRFIELLFQIANASNKTSFDEIEEIRAISIDLKVSHSDYINAKLTISSKDRGGL